MSNKLTIRLQCRPISINSAYYKAGQFKTETRLYRSQVLRQILQYRDNIEAFKKQMYKKLKTNQYALNMRIEHLVPEDIFYTKDGKMSMRAGDVDNYTKLLQDFLTSHKYSSENINKPFFLDADERSISLDIDDRFIQSSKATKVPYKGDRWQIEVVFSIDKIKTYEAP